MDTKSFLKGRSTNAYTFFGNHKKNQGYIFRVYAPNARKVEIIGDFNDWQGQNLRRYSSGVFSTTIKNAKENDRYQYKIYNQYGTEIKKIDPFARKISLDENCALVGDIEYIFKNKKVKTKVKNIYQVHLGSLFKDEEFSFDKLINHCKSNNFDWISFLPLAEYENYKSYGYKNLSLFAFSQRYGQADKFKEFIDLAHKNNIGVIAELDIYEFDNNKFSLDNFDGSNIFGYDYEDIKYNYYGGVNFDPSKNISKSYLLSVINYWLNEFNLDGIMLTNIENAIYWQGDENRGLNENWILLLKDIIDLIHKNDAYVLASFNGVYDLDLNFDYIYDLSFREIIRIMQKAPFDRDNYKNIVQKLIMADNSNKILGFTYVDSYLDEASLAMKMYGEDKISQLKSLFTLLYSLNSSKILFMGDELADFETFSVFEPMNINSDNKQNQAFIKFYNDLVDLYKNELNLNLSNTKILDIGGYSIYAFIKEFDTKKYLVIINFTDIEYKIKSPFVIKEILNSENLDYGGNGNINGTTNKGDFINIMPFASAIFKIK